MKITITWPYEESGRTILCSFLYSTYSETTNANGYEMHEVVLTPRDAVLIALLKGMKSKDLIIEFYEELVRFGLVLISDIEDIDLFLEILKEFGFIDDEYELNLERFSDDFMQALSFKKKYIDAVFDELKQKRTEKVTISS